MSSSSSYQLLPLSTIPEDEEDSLQPRWRESFSLVLGPEDWTSTDKTESRATYTGKTVAQNFDLPEATWTCTDDGLSANEKETPLNKRSRQCVVQNLCVDRKGAFIRKNGVFRENMPKVNLMSSDQESDIFWQPRMERTWGGNRIRAHYVNETVFVHTLYSPSHFSHWLYNGMLPLYSTMKRFGGTLDSWTLRPAHFNADDIDHQGTWEMDHFFRSGKELVLHPQEVSTPFQSLPPADAPICFQRAVIGLGSQCALGYCEHNIPTEVYKSFRTEIADFYWKTPEIWKGHLENAQYAIDHGLEHQDHGQHRKRWVQEDENYFFERRSRHNPFQPRQEANDKDKDKSTQLRCLESARYYNFEQAGPDHVGPEPGELPSRVGQLNPDVADPEVNYRNLYTTGNGQNTQGGKRQLVVGILQREQSRRLLNGDELIQQLVQAGFRVKWMSFDHGCGLAETAYLLRDINVLISPHGSAIGASIFMPNHDPVPTVISIDNSKWAEHWFKQSTSAIGQRFVQTMCGPNNYVDEATKVQCPYYRDTENANKLLESMHLILGLPESMVKTDDEWHRMSAEKQEKTRAQLREYVQSHPEATQLAKEELDVLIGPESRYQEMAAKYGEVAVHFHSEYWKYIPRYVDIGRVLKFVQRLQVNKEEEMQAEETMQQNRTLGASQRSYGLYLDYIRRGKACGLAGCEHVLFRNVADDRMTAFGKHSIDDVTQWGLPTNESKALRQGLTDEVLNQVWTIEG
ncbi:hypothetical protein BGZ83_004876 [Gryganskiella cystojenkinii]|nr:hypothetical protein BGZ83_004876 [Gryganskiella cystojenkinii]